MKSDSLIRVLGIIAAVVLASTGNTPLGVFILILAFLFTD